MPRHTSFGVDTIAGRHHYVVVTIDRQRLNLEGVELRDRSVADRPQCRQRIRRVARLSRACLRWTPIERLQLREIRARHLVPEIGRHFVGQSDRSIGPAFDRGPVQLELRDREQRISQRGIDACRIHLRALQARRGQRHRAADVVVRRG
jgi:hypothetical protein